MANLDQLHTGNSAVDFSFGNEEVSDDQIEAINEQQRQIAELMPDVQFLRDHADAEIAAVSDMRSYITALGDNPNAEAIQAEYRARELYIQYLQRFKGNLADQVALAESGTN